MFDTKNAIFLLITMVMSAIVHHWTHRAKYLSSVSCSPAKFEFPWYLSRSYKHGCCEMCFKCEKWGFWRRPRTSSDQHFSHSEHFIWKCNFCFKKTNTTTKLVVDQRHKNQLEISLKDKTVTVTQSSIDISHLWVEFFSCFAQSTNNSNDDAWIDVHTL